ncbi:ThuA domain-containing protein [Flavobacterium sp. MAH-1]|uniref:ThuA domain-containing protein n=1 Tax=Flavobacterium agri TaxID=2743471 RepID=A0A7Y9C7J1_9FLAO|nr:ThuA domain-containing protein [Flavobacterium agri]NUY81469.1 ThuA domain-containing protein [Flavobacterium agri]NYA71493.1 ThuA domain-containing protein [Flavobacterium agri]
MKKLLFLLFAFSAVAQQPAFKVLAFYTGKNDLAHVSFVDEANKWFPQIAKANNFSYEATSDWSKLNAENLKNYKVVLFLDTRPELPEQRLAFENYMKSGGAFLGFHFSAFALDGSTYPNDWLWYNNEFLGCGQYASNTWRPTSAVLKVEKPFHPAVKNVPSVFHSQPNEWYRWEKDLRLNPDIEILLSIDPKSFPLGTGPKAHEIWHEGYYPVFWANKKYKMAYCNMGHNDMDYEGGTNATLSKTFGNVNQNALIVNTLLWLGSK